VTTSLRVLLAEDDATQRRAVVRLLTGAGAVVEAVVDGAGAVERALAAPFDLVLMDCDMPVMDGVDATRRLRAAGSVVPIVALTGSVHRRRECVAAGMSGFVEKPLTVARGREVCAQLHLTGG
jgi:CheY-like chemotaxis protein